MRTLLIILLAVLVALVALAFYGPDGILPRAAEAAAQAAAPGDAANGAVLLTKYGCDACHIIPGVRTANSPVGPPLTAWAQRRYIAGALPNNYENTVRWLMDPQAIEPGTAMPNMDVTQEHARDMTAYLFRLRNDRWDGE